MNTQQSHNPYTNLKLSNAMLVFRGSQQLRVFSDLRKVRDLLPEEAARKMSPYMDHFIENFSYQYGGQDASMEPLWLGYPERGLWITVCPELDYGEEVGYYDKERTLPKREYGSYDGPTYLVEEYRGKLRVRRVSYHFTPESTAEALEFQGLSERFTAGFDGGTLEELLESGMSNIGKFGLAFDRRYLSDEEIRLYATHCARLTLKDEYPEVETLRSVLDTIERYASGSGSRIERDQADAVIEEIRTKVDSGQIKFSDFADVNYLDFRRAVLAVHWAVSTPQGRLADWARSDSSDWSSDWHESVEYLLHLVRGRQ